MVNQETLETIQAIKDIEFEYNIKLFIIGLMFVYAVFLFWFSFRWNYSEEKSWAKLVNIFIFRIPTLVYIIFMPLFSIFLLRSYSVDNLFILLITIYSVLTIFMLIIMKLGFIEFAANILGFNTKPKNFTIKSERYKF